MLLRVRDLKTYFHTNAGPARAVDGVSFDIDKGETFCLVGESGCGKSVTALSIIQLLPQTAAYHAGGSIEFNGRDLTKMAEMDKRGLRGSQISMIFQDPMTSLNPVFTIGYQVMEPLIQHKGLSAAEARKKAINLLEQVNIPDPLQRIDEYPHQLSGGMKQRVMIAMAMACEPGLLIADEPTTALDVTIQSEILDLMKNLQKSNGTAILLITHDLGVVAEMGHRVGVMYAGRIVENSSQQQILKNPAHPYSVRLLQSLPSRTHRDRALQVIEGRVPPATQYPDYCRFAERCPWVHEPCETIDPKNYPVEAGHDAACVLYDEKIQGRKRLPSELQSPPPPRPRQASAAANETLIQIENLKVHFPIRRGVFKKTVGHVKAVDGVSLSIKKGKTLALVGESGCGKTTLGKALLQLIRPTEGKVLFGGSDLTGLSRGELRPYRRRLQIIFQDPYSSLDPRMMIGEIIEEGMEAQGIGANRHEREERARELLGRVGLDPGVVYRYPHEFSGGQRQRISIARCLAVNPEFIVCDEATSALDVSVQAQILNLLDRLRNELSLTYLFITHNLSAVEYLADEVAVMYLGRIVEYGKTEDVFKNPAHPYTRALLAAVPQIDPASGLEKIKLTGDVPSPVNPPAGCHFHPRCRDVMGRCREAYPESYAVTESHRANCFLYGEMAVGVQSEKAVETKK